MERDYHGSPTEAPLSQTFRRLVEREKALWRANKKPGLTQKSQAIDLPESISRKITNSIVECLPDFVPDELRHRLLENHPAPIFAFSVKGDKRLDMEELGVPFYGYVPNYGDDKLLEVWFKGMRILEEATTHMLTQETVKRLGRKHKWFYPQELASRRMSSHTSAYSGYLQRLKQSFSGEDNGETFMRGLVLSMLSGDDTYANEALKRNKGDINQLALYVGRALSGEETEKHETGVKGGVSSKIGKTLSNTYTVATVRIHNPGIIEISILEPYLAAGVTSGGITGMEIAINNAVNNKPFSGLIFASAIFLAAGAVINTTPSTMVHEVIHYLSQDIDHGGFTKVKQKVS